mgnify:CR=1 FL=1
MAAAQAGDVVQLTLLESALLVDAAVFFARWLGVDDLVIGLTVVAIGTSLPELAASVAGALKGEPEIALGNVLGSNLFNLLAIIGVASLIAPIQVGPGFLQFDFWVMLGASLLLLPFVFFGRDLGRIWGIVLSALYLGYVTVVLL